MRHFTLCWMVSAAALGSACSSSSPTGPDSPSTVVEGRTLNAIDGAAAGASLRIGTRTTQTDAHGYFRMDMGSAGEFGATVESAGYVERQTGVRTSVQSDAQRLSLIPASFDLAAFDQMFRPYGNLQRWTKAPALVILTSVMRYDGANETFYAATAERLSPAELDQMEAHFTAALGLLTGRTFTSFASVTREDVAEGEQVNVLRDGHIVAGRYVGIVSWSHTIGLGRWQVASDSSIGGGAVFLDRDFDRDDERRALLRTHELGHALGYMHVTTRPSVMNPSIGPDPTDFDAQGAAIAFQRPPGNHAPDIDPTYKDPAPFLTIDGARRWGPPIICGLPR
jgi:hypothetical protein